MCLGVCLVYLWCPWGFGINASGRLRGLWGLCSSVGEEFLVLSRFVVPWARYGYGVRLVLYLAYCCFLVPALWLCFFPSLFSCSGGCFRSPHCFVSCCWVVVVVLPSLWYSSFSSCCTRSKASWCSTKSSHIPVFFKKSGLFAMFVRMKSI